MRNYRVRAYLNGVLLFSRTVYAMNDSQALAIASAGVIGINVELVEFTVERED